MRKKNTEIIELNSILGEHLDKGNVIEELKKQLYNEKEDK